MRNFYNEFKTPIVITVLLFAAFFLYTKLVGPIPFSINSVNTTKTDLFSSSGEGKATAIPNSATVQLGISEQATTVADAQNKANQTANKIIDNIKKLGIPEKDIKTTNYSVNPNYDNGEIVPMMYPISGGGNNITGYTVTQNIEVKIKPIEKTNKVVDAGTASGANLVGGINFTFSDDLQKSLEQKARQEAVDNAKEKAKNLANAGGVRLLRVVNIVESSNQPFGIMPMAAGTLEKTDQNTPTNITPGENSVIINVVIYYETY